MKKENLQIAMLTIAIGAGAVTYASNSRSVIFFAITWVIGMLTEYSAGLEPLYPLERATLSAW